MAVSPSFREVTIRYTADTAAVKAGAGEAAQAVEASAKRMEQATAQAERAQKAVGQAVQENATRVVQSAAQVGGAQQVASAAMGRTEMSAKAMSAALRGVPAQFTDIAVSLASGQAPMTVFLQQGGQLKDMFGGAGNAARALGGYVLGLVNPLTVAAGALGVLYLAYEQTRSESAALDMALVKSGNSIGGTVTQLRGMTAALHANGVGMGAATAGLVTLIETGGVAREHLEAFTQTALDLERYGSTAVDKTAKAFKALADEPAAASLKLTASVGALTAAQYEQIRSLEEQGRKTDAARIAQLAFADATKTTVEAYKANMGPLDRALSYWTEKALKMWAALRGTGETGDSRLAEARERLAELERRDTGFASTEGGAAVGGRVDRTRLQAQIAAQRELVAYLERATQAANDNAAAEANRQQVQRDGMAAITAVGDAQDKGRSKQEQMNAALEGYRANIERIRAANPDSALLDPAKIAAGEAAIRAQYTSGENANRVLERQASLMAELSGLSTDFHRDWADLTAVFQRGGMSVDQLAEAQAALLAKQPAIRAEAEAQKKAQKELADAAADAAAVQIKAMNDLADARLKATRDAGRNNDTLREGNKRLREEVELMGLSEEAQQAVAQARMDATIATKEQELASLSLGESYTREMALLEEEIELLKERATLQGKKFDGQAVERQMREEEKAWERLSDSVYDSLTDALFRSFEAGGGFFDSFWNGIKNTLKTTVLRTGIEFGVAGIGGALGLMGDGTTGASGAMNALKGVSDAYGLYDKGMKAYGWLSGAGSATGVTSSLGSAFYTAPALFGGGAALAGTATTALAGGALGSGTVLGTGALLGSSGGALGTGTAFLGSGAANLAIGTGAATGAGVGAGVGAGASAGAGGAGTGALGAMGPYGWIALAVIAAIAMFAGKGEKRSGGQYTTSSFDEDGAATNIAFKGGPSGGELAGDYARELVTGTTQGINSLLKDMGSSLSLASFHSGLEQSGKGRGGVYAGGTLTGGIAFGESGVGDNYAGTLFERTSTQSPDAETAVKNYATDMLQATIQALQAANDLPKVIADQLRGVDAEAMTDEAARAFLQSITTQVQGINAMRDALDRMPFTNLQGLSFDAAAALIELTGGVDALGTVLTGYEQNFHSAAERTAQATAQMRGALEALGLEMPDLAAGSEAARAQYRALVEAQDVSTEAGRASWAALMTLQGAFAELTPMAQEAAGALGAVARSAADVARERESLERQLAQVQGDTAALRAMELAALDESNRPLQERIWAIEDEKAAQDAAAAAIQAARERATAAAQAQVQAAQQVYEAWKRVNDSLVAEVKRIRGLADGSGQGGYAQAQADVAIAHAKARAGDQDAASNLPALTRAMLELAEKNEGSEVDLRRVQLRAANSLADTAALLARKFGLQVPSYEVGTSYVPRDGLAMLHEGEAVLTKAQNPAAGGAGAGATQTEMAALRRELRTGLNALLLPMQQQLSLARKWDKQGLPVRSLEGEPLETVAA